MYVLEFLQQLLLAKSIINELMPAACRGKFRVARRQPTSLSGFHRQPHPGHFSHILLNAHHIGYSPTSCNLQLSAYSASHCRAKPLRLRDVNAENEVFLPNRSNAQSNRDQNLFQSNMNPIHRVNSQIHIFSSPQSSRTFEIVC